jgi:hypothetical protein
MLRKFRLPSPALVVACVALFVALVGTATAVTVATVPPLAKRALVAENSKRLGGKTTAQLLVTTKAQADQAAKAAAQAAASAPGPASTTAGLTSIKTLSLGGLPPGAVATRQVACDPGQTAIGGGISSDTRVVAVFDSFQLNPTTWQVGAGNFGGGAANVTFYAVCQR